MNPIARGILWEEWHRTRKLLAVIAGALILVALMVRLGRADSSWFGVVQFLSYITLICGLQITYNSEADLRAGMPTRRFLLPANNFALALWPFAYGLAIVIAMLALWVALATWVVVIQPHPLSLLCLLTAAAAATHALAWTAPLIGRWPTIFSAFMLLLLSAGLLPVPYPYFPYLELILTPVVIMAALLVTTFAVGRLRSGATLLPKMPRVDLHRKPSTQIAITPFSNTLRAQVWLEWRSYARRMSWLLACAPCAYVTLLNLMGHPDPFSLVEIVAALLPYLAIPAGLWTFTRQNLSERHGPQFLPFTRPQEDVNLAKARLTAAMGTILQAYGLTLAVIFLGHFVFGKIELGRVDAQDLALIILGPISLWIAYTQGAAIIAAFLVVGSIAMLVPSSLRPGERVELQFFIAIAGAAILSLAITLWHSQKLRGEFASTPTRRPWERSILALGFACIAATIYILLTINGKLVSQPIRWTVTIAMTILIITPYFRTIQIVHRRRHR